VKSLDLFVYIFICFFESTGHLTAPTPASRTRTRRAHHGLFLALRRTCIHGPVETHLCWYPTVPPILSDISVADKASSTKLCITITKVSVPLTS